MTSDPLGILWGAVLLAATWIAWGAQIVVPFRGIGGAESMRRSWSLLAAPLCVIGVAAVVAWAGLRPEALVHAGVLPWGGSIETRVLSILVPALLAADLLVLFGARKISGRSWGVPALLGLGALGAIASLAIRLSGDSGDGGLLASWASQSIAIVVWIALAIAAGQGVAPAPKPRLGACLAFGAAPLYFGVLSPALRAEVIEQGALAPLAAGTLLGLVAAALSNRKLARGSAAAATLLLALHFTWVARLGDRLAEQLPAMPPLPG